MAIASGPFPHEHPEKRQPQLARVRRFLAVHEDVGSRALAHDLEELAQGRRSRRLERRFVTLARE
jgi:hypothetical protein